MPDGMQVQCSILQSALGHTRESLVKHPWGNQMVPPLNIRHSSMARYFEAFHVWDLPDDSYTLKDIFHRSALLYNTRTDEWAPLDFYDPFYGTVRWLAGSAHWNQTQLFSGPGRCLSGSGEPAATVSVGTDLYVQTTPGQVLGSGFQAPAGPTFWGEGLAVSARSRLVTEFGGALYGETAKITISDRFLQVPVMRDSIDTFRAHPFPLDWTIGGWPMDWRDAPFEMGASPAIYNGAPRTGLGVTLIAPSQPPFANDAMQCFSGWHTPWGTTIHGWRGQILYTGDAVQAVWVGNLKIYFDRMIVSYVLGATLTPQNHQAIYEVPFVGTYPDPHAADPLLADLNFVNIIPPDIWAATWPAYAFGTHPR